MNETLILALTQALTLAQTLILISIGAYNGGKPNFLQPCSDQTATRCGVLVFCVDTDTMYQEFVDHPKMAPIKRRTVWIHVDVPGQGFEAPDLPAE